MAERDGPSGETLMWLTVAMRPARFNVRVVVLGDETMALRTQPSRASTFQRTASETVTVCYNFPMQVLHRSLPEEVKDVP